jgi:predicted transcriptional regulator
MPEDTAQTEQKQADERWAVFARAKRLGITQKRMARELNRTQGSISKAFKGEKPTLLGRIVRFLDRVERYRKAA